MDGKEHSLLKYYHSKFKNSLYDERDVYGFLILVREYQPKNSPIREFGDFIAHRERDRGHFKDFIQKANIPLGKEVESTVDNVMSTLLNSKAVFTETEMINSINQIFENENLELLTYEIYNGILLCIMSLLQEIEFVEHNKVSGKLFLAFNKQIVTIICEINMDKEVILLAMLRIPNLFIEYKVVDKNQIAGSPNEFITIDNFDGRLIARSLS